LVEKFANGSAKQEKKLGNKEWMTYLENYYANKFRFPETTKEAKQ